MKPVKFSPAQMAVLRRLLAAAKPVPVTIPPEGEPMKVTDSRTITVEIDGTSHTLTLAELQRLYDEIGKVHGIRSDRIVAREPTVYPWGRPLGEPYRTTWTSPSPVIAINTSNHTRSVA